MASQPGRNDGNTALNIIEIMRPVFEIFPFYSESFEKMLPFAHIHLPCTFFSFHFKLLLSVCIKLDLILKNF